MRSTKRFLTVLALLALCLTLLAVSAFAAEEVASGTCGTNVNWVLDSEGTLTIYGTGNMTNYSESSVSPWHTKRTSVQNVVIEDGVTSIGSYAFYSNLKMESVSIGASVTSIGSHAFDSCTKLASVMIPNSVTYVGDYAFNGCTALKAATLSSGMGYVDDYMFYNCSALTDVTIPEGVTSIDDYAFYGCTGMTAVTIPNSVASVGYSAFRGCTGLTSIVIPEGVTYIDECAFWNCTALTSVTIPSTLSWVGYDAFYGCAALKRVDITDLEAWLSLDIEAVDSTPLRYGAALYLNGELLTEVVIPDGVTTIRNVTFYGCTSLTSVSIPKSVTSIGVCAFEGCTGLTSIVIPEGVTSIDEYAFSGCTGLTSIVIPESVISIGYDAFRDCTGLTSIVIPEGVTSIGEGAFYGCTGLTSIVIPEGVTSIGGCAFEGCTGLTSVVISEGVTSIGEAAFYNCTNLADVYYMGSEEAWGKISIDYGNSYLTNATIHYNGDGVCPHEYVPVVTAPTCTEKGYTTNTCSLCGNSYISNQVASLGHSYQAAVTKPTCTKGGYTTHTCTNCGDSYQDTPTPATGHSYGKWSADVPPTCTADGTIIRTCTGCGKTESGAIAATGHSYMDGICENCGFREGFLPQPAITKLENKATGISIKWDAVEGAQYYQVFVKVPGGWEAIGCTSDTSLFYTGVKSGETYRFTIRCKNAEGEVVSTHSRAGWQVTYIGRPSIYKIANTANGVAIAWNKVPGAAKYKIVAKTATSGWKTIAYSTGSTYTWTGATSGETYTFGIVCVTSDGKTVTSAFDSAGKTIKYIACPKIAKLEKTSTGIKVTWDKVVGAAKYKLIVKEEGGSWKTIWNTINSSYTWTGAVKGKTYIFSIRCTTADGKSYTSGWNSTGWTIKYN